jgi:hypothetical protein
MKSPFLILFIIFNLLAINLVSANNMYDEKMTESHLIQLQDDSELGVCIDESVCSHFCHISSHMLGLISPLAQVVTVASGSTYFISNASFHSLILTPPSQPPKA